MTPRHPVFVVGAPRTGTMLVREIRNRHPDVHLFDEVHFFERIWDDRGRLGAYNLRFRTGKPFRVAKRTRVLALFRRAG